MYKYLKYIFLATISIILINCSEDPVVISDTGTITGIVVTDGVNQPVENVRISTNPSTSTVFTDENGEFILENVPVDQYSVQAELEGFLTGFEAANVSGGTSVNVVIDLRDDDSDNRSPLVPTLINPIDGAIDVPLDIELAWSSNDPDEDEITYSVEIRNDLDEELLRFTELTDTILQVPNLRFDVRYFWQVSATDSIIDSPVLSQVGTFTTESTPNNRFVFVRNINGNNVIFSSDENGNEVQLTSESNNSFRPRRSLTANRIAFLSNNGGQTHIFTMEPDGQNIEQVTSAVQVNGFNLEEIDFIWTSDGSRLLYSNFDRLYSINANGSGLEQIYQTTDGSFISEVAISADESRIVLKTNNSVGYNISIFSIDNTGTIIDNVLSGVLGAAGGLDISIDNQSILYWYDVSGFESTDFRQLDSRIFIYEVATGISIDISDQKDNGTNDFDCRFTPNEAEVILTNTSNDGLSQRNILIIDVNPLSTNTGGRDNLIENAEMPDFE